MQNQRAHDTNISPSKYPTMNDSTYNSYQISKPLYESGNFLQRSYSPESKKQMITAQANNNELNKVIFYFENLFKITSG